jgi:type IX secretion system PorP/SprF family membrane protein
MSKWLLSVIIMVSGLTAEAQNNAQHTLYMVDIYRHNVAYGGFDRSLSANFNYRTQWAGLDGQPNSVYFNAHLPVYLLNGGAGFSLSTDKSGGLRISEMQLSYNRVRSFGRGIVSFGGSLGLRQLGIDGGVIRTPDGIYQGGFSHEDPILFIDSQAGSHLNWNLAFFTKTDFFDLGLSVRNLFANATDIEGINFISSRQINAYGAIPFFVNDLEIQASLYMKTNLQQWQTDMSVIVKSGNVFGGLSIRGFNENSFDSAIFLGGVRLNEHYTLSYSYDVSLGGFSDFNQGSHEILINYNLNKLIGIGLPPEIIYNPRDL